MGCLPDRISAKRLRDPRYGSLDHRLGGLGREVARRDTRSARREDESGGARELADRGRDLRTLVRHDPVLDVEMLGLEQFDEKPPALVVALARRHSVRDCHDGRPHSGSFVFSTSVTSPMDMSLSIAFAMS